MMTTPVPFAPFSFKSGVMMGTSNETFPSLTAGSDPFDLLADDMVVTSDAIYGGKDRR